MTVDSAALDLLPFTDADYVANPYPFYAAARAVAPVYESPMGIHVVLQHRHVAKLVRDQRLSARQLDFGVGEIFHDSVLGQDAPDHTRLRRISAKWLTPAPIAEWSAVTRRLADQAIDNAEPHGGMDLVHDYAFPITFATMAHILGVTAHDGPTLREKTLEIGRGLRPAATEEDLAGAAAAFAWFSGYVGDLIADKRRNPGTGMLDAFLDAQREERMSDAEVIASTTLFYAVGHLDITFLIANGLRMLVDLPEAARAFVAKPEARAEVLNEVLRLDTPEQFVVRAATEDIDVDGYTIPKGAVVMLMIAAANKDPGVFPDPERFDPGRDMLSSQLAFNAGMHGCAGQLLARAEGEIAIERFLARCPNYSLGPVSYNHTEFLRIIDRLPVRFN